MLKRTHSQKIVHKKTTAQIWFINRNKEKEKENRCAWMHFHGVGVKWSSISVNVNIFIHFFCAILYALSHFLFFSFLFYASVFAVGFFVLFCVASFLYFLRVILFQSNIIFLTCAIFSPLFFILLHHIKWSVEWMTKKSQKKHKLLFAV